MKSSNPPRCALIVLTIAMLCVCGACALIGLLGLWNTPLPASFDVPVLSSLGIVFQDDFSSQSRSQTLGWSFGALDYGEQTWSPNQFKVMVKKDSGGISLPNCVAKDFGVEIEAQPENEPGIEYGIAFRYSSSRDRVSAYVFRITTDGKYALLKKVDGKVAYKTPAPVTSSSFIKPGSSKNRLGVLADGSTILLYINGNLVDTITDKSLTSGSVGIYVSSGTNAQAQVTFSRMTVYGVQRARIELGKR